MLIHLQKIMKKIIPFTFALVTFLYTSNIKSQENVIIPKQKPILKQETKEKKISINIIKPLKKPVLTIQKKEKYKSY